jgi:lipopolysaccharide/colanic/teichoic acid biosynthesis glycosyltransferase
LPLRVSFNGCSYRILLVTPEANVKHTFAWSKDVSDARAAREVLPDQQAHFRCDSVPVADAVHLSSDGLALWLENPGPIVFTQLRTGRGGRRFRMYKLRSMVTNAEELKQQLRHLNELTWPDFKVTNDPRVTRVGRILRKTSVDELPQIFNVIRGDMSLVGPRPTSFSANTYMMWHTERLEVTPGITGLWQVSGRSNVDFDDRLRLDIEYIRKRSLWFDIKLIFRTVIAVANSKGAY